MLDAFVRDLLDISAQRGWVAGRAGKEKQSATSTATWGIPITLPPNSDFDYYKLKKRVEYIEQWMRDQQSKKDA